jgi:hypothetical protein
MHSGGLDVVYATGQRVDPDALQELRENLQVTLSSNTIEWGINLQICDSIAANAQLQWIAIGTIHEKMISQKIAEVQLALTLLEIMVKNIGQSVCELMTPQFTDALLALVNRPNTIEYKMARGFFKRTGFGGLNETDRAGIYAIRDKVLYLVQMWTDAFIMNESTMQPIFELYKTLRKEGAQFPPRDENGKFEIAGAQQSPAFTPALATSKHLQVSKAKHLNTDEIEELKELLQDASPLTDLRPKIQAKLPGLRALIERHSQDVYGGGNASKLDQQLLQGFIDLYSAAELRLEGKSVNEVRFHPPALSSLSLSF